jgi:hypothetical protein
MAVEDRESLINFPLFQFHFGMNDLSLPNWAGIPCNRRSPFFPFVFNHFLHLPPPARLTRPKKQGHSTSNQAQILLKVRGSSRAASDCKMRKAAAVAFRVPPAAPQIGLNPLDCES